MSTPSPIIPPGSPLHRQNAASNRKLVITIFAILTLHVLVLAGLLIQGCKREDRPSSAFDNTLSNLPPVGVTTAPPGPTQDQARVPSSAPEEATAPLPAAPAARRSQPPGDAVTTTTEPPPVLTHPNAVPPIESLTQANPATAAPPHNLDSHGPATTYSVKTGDNLTRIARNHHTTVRAIRALNNLKTDRVLVGQKLKIPAASASPEPVITAPADTGAGTNTAK